MAANLINDTRTKTQYAFQRLREEFGNEINNIHTYIDTIQQLKGQVLNQQLEISKLHLKITTLEANTVSNNSITQRIKVLEQDCTTKKFVETQMDKMRGETISDDTWKRIQINEKFSDMKKQINQLSAKTDHNPLSESQLNAMEIYKITLDDIN